MTFAFYFLISIYWQKYESENNYICMYKKIEKVYYKYVNKNSNIIKRTNNNDFFYFG